MAETTADVRRDIELTRERMSDTLAELERRLNLMQIVRDHPWPAIAVAAAAGFALSGTRADVKAAGATAAVAHGATEKVGRVGPALDDLIALLLGGVQDVLMERADELVAELLAAIGGSGARRGAGMTDGLARGAMSHPTTAADGVGNGALSGAAFGGESRDLGTRDVAGNDPTGMLDGRSLRAD